MKSETIPDFPDLPIKTLDYFYVGKDRQEEGRTILHYPISPNYRTLEEARLFLASCRIDDAKVIGCSFIIDENTDVAGLEQDIFGRAAA